MNMPWSSWRVTKATNKAPPRQINFFFLWTPQQFKNKLILFRHYNLTTYLFRWLIPIIYAYCTHINDSPNHTQIKVYYRNLFPVIMVSIFVRKLRWFCYKTMGSFKVEDYLWIVFWNWMVYCGWTVCSAKDLKTYFPYQNLYLVKKNNSAINCNLFHTSFFLFLPLVGFLLIENERST